MTNESIADIISEMRFHGQQNIDAEKDKTEYGILTVDGRIAQNYADRLEAANKRDVDKLNSAIQATVGRSDAEIDRLRREIAELKRPGNAAAMREALSELVANIEMRSSTFGLNAIVDTKTYLDAKAALAAPPRNCDMPLIVDGPADNNADKAWLVFKHRNPDAYFDVSGLLSCIDWLLAPATERKGGGNGNE